MCCGQQIPEGMQVCANCVKKSLGIVHKETKEERFERIMNDWVIPILLVVFIVIMIIMCK